MGREAIVWGEGKPQKLIVPSSLIHSQETSGCLLGPSLEALSIQKTTVLLYYHEFIYTCQRFYTRSLSPLPCSVNSSQRHRQSHVPKASVLTAHTCLPIPLQLSFHNPPHNKAHPSDLQITHTQLDLVCLLHAGALMDQKRPEHALPRPQRPLSAPTFRHCAQSVEVASG